MRKVSHAPTPRWPFWLLIVAWGCANSPQTATYAVMTWLADARSFAHQQQLTFDVAHLLAGEKAPVSTENVGAAQDNRPTTPVSSIPAAAVLKKIDLSWAALAGLVPPTIRVVAWDPAYDCRSDALRAPPPHDPPRAVAFV